GLTELDFNDCKSCPWRAGAALAAFFLSKNLLEQPDPLRAAGGEEHLAQDLTVIRRDGDVATD
ncbi:MAG: hypothetical protein ACXWE1_04275, partial [Thermoanaerobaculia bacterium]